MTSEPPRWNGCEFAERLQITTRNLHTQLGEWARLGFITRTGFATSALNTPASPASLDNRARSSTTRHGADAAARQGRNDLGGARGIAQP
jgi:hypothetical protein